jgi:hypothetical protein
MRFFKLNFNDKVLVSRVISCAHVPKVMLSLPVLWHMCAADTLRILEVFKTM